MGLHYCVYSPFYNPDLDLLSFDGVQTYPSEWQRARDKAPIFGQTSLRKVRTFIAKSRKVYLNFYLGFYALLQNIPNRALPGGTLTASCRLWHTFRERKPLWAGSFVWCSTWTNWITEAPHLDKLPHWWKIYCLERLSQRGCMRVGP